jgi:hypothetical protein
MEQLIKHINRRLGLMTHWDLDGVGCLILLNHVFKFEHIQPTSYKKVDENIDKISMQADNLFLTDISLEQEQADNISTCFNKAFVIDHHETTKLVKFPKMIKSIVDMRYSATGLVYKWMTKKLNYKFSDSVKELAKYVNDYDLFTLKHENSLIANEIFWSAGSDSFWNFFDRFKDGWLPTGTDMKTGREKLQAKLDEIESVPKEIFGKLLVIASDKQINEVQFVYPEFDVYLIITEHDKASLRAKVNLLPFIEHLKTDFLLGNEIASTGGHKHACGVTFKEGTNIMESKFIEDLFNFANNGDVNHVGLSV